MSNETVDGWENKFVGDEHDGIITPGPDPTKLAVDSLIEKLAAVYKERLSTEPLSRRFAHHVSHVASEYWLCQELAFLVNNEGISAGLSDWHASLERKHVDVTLVNQATQEKIYLEFKQVPPDWWRSNWKQVYKDLGYSKSGPIITSKPRANYAVCVAVYRKSWPNQRPATVRLWEKYLASVPDSPGTFVPYSDDPPLPPLQVVANSHRFAINWNRPSGEVVCDAWCQIWWVRLADGV